LLLLIIWGSASFFLFSSFPLIKWAVVLISLLAVYLVLASVGELLLLFLINFTTTYAFYGLLFSYNLPVWFIMIGIIAVSAVTFILLSGKILTESSRFVLMVMFYVISMIELYLTLSYWLVNPLTRSLIMSVFVYIFVGFLSSIKGNIFVGRSFRTYLFFAILVMIMLLFTMSWGS
jgi:hypothetical protein